MINPKLTILIFVFLLAFLGGCGNGSGKSTVEEPGAPQASGEVEIPADYVFNPDVKPVELKMMEHPRGIGSAARFDAIRSNPDGIEYRMIVERAKELDQMIASGTLTDPEDAASAPILYALTYKLSGDEHFLDLSREVLGMMLERNEWYIAPETSNFEQLQRATGVAAMYDILYDSLNEDERRYVEAFLIEHVVPVVRYKTWGADEKISFWINEPHSNYYVVWHSTLGWLALVLGEKLPGYETDAAYAYERLQVSMDLIEEENGWREGITYLDFCWGQKAFYFLLSLQRNSELNPLGDEFLSVAAKFAAYGVLPGGMGSNSFGDNEPYPKPGISFILRMRAMHPHPNWDKIVKLPVSHEGLDHDAWVFYAMAEPIPDSEGWEWLYEMPLAQYFPGIEWVVVRSSWDPNAIYFACKSGIAGYGHNHLDQCSIILAAGGKWALFDKGVGGDMSTRWADSTVNNYFEAPIGHNTIVIGDGIYDDLGMWPDNPKYFAKPGKIENFIYNKESGVITFTADGSGLFPTEPVTKFKRHFYVNINAAKQDDLILVVDEVELSEPRIIRSAWHSRSEWKINYGGLNECMSEPAPQLWYGSTRELETSVDFQDTGMEDRNTHVLFIGPPGEVSSIRMGYTIRLFPYEGSDGYEGVQEMEDGRFNFLTPWASIYWDPETGLWSGDIGVE